MNNGGRAVPFTREEREKLEELKDCPLSSTQIGLQIGRSKNSVVLEYRRAGGRETYNAEQAHNMAAERKEERKRRLSKSAKLQIWQIDKIKEIKLAGVPITATDLAKVLKISYFAAHDVAKTFEITLTSLKSLEISVDARLYAIEENIKIIMEVLNIGTEEG